MVGGPGGVGVNPKTATSYGKGGPIVIMPMRCSVLIISTVCIMCCIMRSCTHIAWVGGGYGTDGSVQGLPVALSTCAYHNG